MTLRRPAAHLRKPPTWRRSGDDSYWETLGSEGEVLPLVSRPPRAPRPQSAIEGGQLDQWLEELQRIQNQPLGNPVEDQVPAFNNYTASMDNLDRDAPGRSWRQHRVLPSSRGSSPCGTPSLYDSSFGSQDSLQTGIFSPTERRGSWERAHIMQTPNPEQTQLSNLSAVKLGWLPIQRKVLFQGPWSTSRDTDPSSGQVKLKQPITPTFQKNPPAADCRQDDTPQRSQSSVGTSNVRTWQVSAQPSNIIKQAVETSVPSANDGDKPVSWQTLKRGWKINRVSSVPGGTQSTTTPTGTSSDHQWKKTSAIEPFSHFPLLRTASTEPCRDQVQTKTERYHTPLQRSSSVQPLKPQPSQIHTSSVATTLIPQNKAGFSSITISSKKVNRSSSLPGPQPMDTVIPQQVTTVERKATIVKVTEQRVTTNSKLGENQSASHATDTVVHRRKATIIKVTEHRESYSPAKKKDYRHSYTEGLYQENSVWTQGNQLQNHVATQHSIAPKDPNKSVTEHRESYSPAKNKDYRRSYSEGLYQENNVWTKGNQPQNHVSTKHPIVPKDPDKNMREHRESYSLAKNKEYRHSYTEGLYQTNSVWTQGNQPQNHVPTRHSMVPNDLDTNESLHRSTVSLFVNNPTALVAPAPSEAPLRPRSGRPPRPLSCYGAIFGQSEPSQEHATTTPARKWSLEARISPVNPDRSSTGSGTALTEVGQPMTDAFQPKKHTAEVPEPPGLTLIKTTGRHSHQTPEEVLALNAAAIIANIKLQRQISKTKSQNGKSEQGAHASPQGNTGHSPPRHSPQPHAGFIPLSQGQRSTGTFSLQELLQKSRPDFIIRSQNRLKQLERKVKQRKEHPGTTAVQHYTDLSRPTDGSISGKEFQFGSKRTFTDVKKKKEEEKKKEACLDNRQRMEVFKKKLLDQILQRTNE